MKSHTISFRIPDEDHLLLQKIRSIGGMGRARACRLAFGRGLRALRDELLASEDATVGQMLVRFADPLKTAYPDTKANPFGRAPTIEEETEHGPSTTSSGAMSYVRNTENGGKHTI